MKARSATRGPLLDPIRLTGLAAADGSELRAGGSYDAQSFDGCDLSGRGLTGIGFLECEFRGVSLDDATLRVLLAATGAQTGDLLFFGAGPWKAVCDFMGALRLKVAKDAGLIGTGWAPLWVTDFPMFEWDEEANRYVALHHPFTAPAVDDVADLRANAKTAVSRGYDMVLNGNEIGGGSIRIHNSAMQSTVFELLGIGAEEAEGVAGPQLIIAREKLA